jgi:formylglycine-generating enzyme required for sulfatase activity
MQTFEFEMITVNGQGEITGRETHRAQQLTEELGNGVFLEMVAIPGGTFRMGSHKGQGYEDERPQHSVWLEPFWLGKYPVTQAQWAEVMNWTPPYRCQGAKRPVDRVSWYAAQEFCERLSQQTGRIYSLPTEAQWEYACRAGTTTPFYFGETLTTDLANYVGEYTYRAEPKGVYRHETTEVGNFPSNGFGLYDLHGNVWEWCADAWHDNYIGAPANGQSWEHGGTQRVARGGSWHDPPDLCRCATRLKLEPTEGEDLVGFRVALTSLERQELGQRGSDNRLTVASWLRWARRLARRIRQGLIK